MASIVFLYDRFAPQIGGIERKIAELGEGLAEAGHRVAVVARPTARLRGVSDAGLIRVFRGWPWGRLAARAFQDADLIYGFGFTPHSPRALYGLTMAGDLLDRGIPLAWCPTLYPLRAPAQGGRVERSLWKRAVGRVVCRSIRATLERAYVQVFRRCRSLYALRERERDHWRQLCPDVPVRLIPDGVSRRHRRCTRKADARARVHALLGAGPVVLCVGRMNRMKNQELLIRAIPPLREKFPSLRLVLVGPDREADGPTLQRLARQLDDAGAILFTGPLPDADLCELYAGADLVAHPSRYEASGLTPLEALAHATPVVHSGRAGLERLSRLPGSRVIEDVDDRDLWAATISDVLAGPASIAAEARRGRSVVLAQYTWDPLIRAISEDARRGDRNGRPEAAHA